MSNLIIVQKPGGSTLHYLDATDKIDGALCGEKPKGKISKPAYWWKIDPEKINSVIRQRTWCQKCIKLNPSHNG